MVSSRKLTGVTLIAGTLGARIKRSERTVKNAVYIAGTPVLNYNLAYNGHSNLNELTEEQVAALEQDWVLIMEPGTSDKKIASLCEMGMCVRQGQPEEGGVPYLEVRSTEGQLGEIIKAAKGSVQFVEPDGEVQLIPEIEDVEASASWGLDAVGAPSRSNGGNGAHIYVLDTGVRASHDDFGGRVTPTLDLTSGQLVECGGSSSCARDVQGHGTHCAGTAGGRTYGVAPQAEIHSIKVLSDQGSGDWGWSYDSLDWLARKAEKPAVASMSLGGQAVLNAMKVAVDGAVNAGVTVVVAGGNSNSDACGFSPAHVPSAITVGSTDSRNRRSSFSNYGSCTNIWAPGTSITSASHTSDSGSRSLSGTSMACPHVSGAAALVLEQNPTYKSSQVLDNLLKNAIVDSITGLKSSDTNAFLYVGAGGPPDTTPRPPGNCPWHGCIWGCGGDNCEYCERCQSLVEASETAETTASCSAIDYAIVDGMGAYSFSEKMAKCGRDALNWAFQWQKNTFISCAQRVGISNSCAKCYEGAGKYGYDNCKTACLASWCSSGCLSCTARYDSSLERCVGRGRPTLTPCR